MIILLHRSGKVYKGIMPCLYMNELETFKDWMDKWEMDIKLDPSLQDLKQEAIKWVKNRWGYAKKISDEEKVIRVSDLLNFFNITPEDLQ